MNADNFEAYFFKKKEMLLIFYVQFQFMLQATQQRIIE
jgi:hypothetical protein